MGLLRIKDLGFPALFGVKVESWTYGLRLQSFAGLERLR